MHSKSFAKKAFCALLCSVIVLAGWAAISPAPAQGSSCDILCIDAPNVCPPGQSPNVGMRRTGGGFSCCIGCGGGCVPNERCVFGPHGCNTFCGF